MNLAWRVRAALAATIACAALAACASEHERLAATHDELDTTALGGGGGAPPNPAPSDCGFTGTSPGDGQCRYSVDNRSIEVDHCPDGYGCPKSADDTTTHVANCISLGDTCSSASFPGLVAELGDRDYFTREAAQKQIAACCASTGYLAMLDDALGTTEVPEIGARLERAIGACKFALRPCGCEPVKGDTPICTYPVASYTGKAVLYPYCNKEKTNVHTDLECLSATFGPPVSVIPSPFFSLYYLDPSLRCPQAMPEGKGGHFYRVVGDIPLDDGALCDDADKLKAFIAKMAPTYCNDRERTEIAGIGPVPACLAPGVPDITAK